MAYVYNEVGAVILLLWSTVRASRQVDKLVGLRGKRMDLAALRTGLSGSEHARSIRSNVRMQRISLVFAINIDTQLHHHPTES